MQGFKKSIEFFHDEKYRNLEYGIVYYVPGFTTSEINGFVKRNAKRIAKLINENNRYWIACKIIFLDSDNTLFPQNETATFYSAMIPTAENLNQGYSFLVATLDNCTTEMMCIAFDRYFDTLLKMFDEVLDFGSYQSFHILFAEDFSIADAVCIKLADGVAPISGFSSHELGCTLKRNYLSRLEITPNTYQVLLTDYGRELHFTAQVKALYVLFLRHPKGIRMKEISDYKEEYKQLYFCFANRSDLGKLRESVEKLFDAWNTNALNVKKSQCSEELKRIIPENDIRSYYEIEVHRGHPHKIRLDRELVTLPESLL